MNTDESSTNIDPENDFFEVFNCDKIDADILISSIKKSRETISSILHIPTNTLILNYEVFTRHPFGGSLREREVQPFYYALLYVSKFIFLLNKLNEKNQNAKLFADKVRESLHDEWEDCTHCPQLQHIMKAAFGIVSEDDELLDSSFQPKYISFLADVFLLQSTLCSCRFFQHILTAVGKIFVLLPAKKYQNRINTFRDNERNSSLNDEHSTDFQSFLRLVGNISRLRKGNDDFAYKFHQEGNIFIHYATDFVSKSLFATFIDTLAALTKNTSIADEFYKRLNESLSDIINLKHIVEVFSGYASDYQNNEINQHKLDYDDANSLEAILHLLSSFFKFSKDIREDIIDDTAGRYDDTRTGFVSSLLILISSPIPASLKAAIFDTLSSMTVDTKRAEDIWQKLEGSQILTQEFVTNGNGGIISDIDIVETDAKSFPLMRSFISFLSSFLSSKPSPQVLESGGRYFKIYHQFLMEHGLMKLRSRIFLHFHEKWSILSKICQTWTNLLLLDNKEASSCLMQTALCDSRFIGELITLINEDDIPEESLLCMSRLLLLIIENESKFLKTMESSDRIFYTPLTKRFSWSSNALVKLIQCVASNDYDLQLVTLNLAQHLAKDSPDITQIVFSRPQAKTIMSFKKVINFDDTEFEEKGRNVRNTLLELLISLGSSSYFVRYVCNFDLMDPPQSIINSTLEKGILPEILRKMKETEAAKNFPIFAANSLKFFLMICENPITSKPLLNLLRTSPQSFFDKQLRILQDSHCSLTAIGCFLQLLARETMDSMNDSYSSTTLLTFRILMETNGFREQSRPRIVLFDEFIDRIDDGDEGECVARGIFETTVAYILSTSAVKTMKENQGHWSKIWCQFLIHLLEKISLLFNSASIDFLSQAVGIISVFLFSDSKLGDITKEERIKILNFACRALKSLNLNAYSRQNKLSIYSLISYMKLSDIQKSFHEHEKTITVNLASDLQADTPVLKAAVFTAAESIINVANVENLQNNFIIKAIHTIHNNGQETNSNFSGNQKLRLKHADYNYFIENPGAASMIVAQYSFFNRLLILMPNEYKTFLVENSLIGRIGCESFWNIIRESFFTSTQFLISETILQVASKALHVMTALCIYDRNNEDVKKGISEFYFNYYEEQFLPIFHLPETLTLNALQFLLDLTQFLSFLPASLTERDEVKKIICDVKKMFNDNPEKIKDKVRSCGMKTIAKPSIEELKKIDVVVEKFKNLF